MKWLAYMAVGALAVVLGACTGSAPQASAPALQKVKVKRIKEPSPERLGPVRQDALRPARPAPARPEKGKITQVDLQRVFELQGTGQILLVDVRPTFHYNLGHIPGAVGMPKRTFESGFPARRAEFDAAVADGRVIVLYCANEDCPDGYAAAKILARKGYSSSVYKGGWEEWKASGL